MNIREFASILGKTALPGKYRVLSALSMKKIMSTVFVSLCFIVVLSLLVAIPVLITLPSKVENTLSSFESFTASLSVVSAKPVVLLSNPKVVVNVGEENVSDAKVLFSNDGITYPKYALFGSQTTSWDQLKDVKENSSIYATWILTLVVLLIPLLVLLLGVFALVQAVVLVPLMWLVMFLFTQLGKFFISKRQLFKIAILGLIPFFVVELLPFAYVRWIIVPCVVYVFIVFGATWLVCERKKPHSLPKKKSQ